MTLSLSSLLLAAGTATTTAKKSSSGGSAITEIGLLVAVGLVFYFVMIRPRKNRMKQQQVKAKTLDVGTEVMSVGGIMGTIVGMTDTTFDVEVADGVVLTFVHRAINARPVTAATDGGRQDDEGDMPADPWDEPPGTTDDDDDDDDSYDDDDDDGEDPDAQDDDDADEHDADEHDADEHDGDEHDDDAGGYDTEGSDGVDLTKGGSSNGADHPADERSAADERPASGETDRGSGGNDLGRS